MSVPRLSQQSVDELFANKNRKGVDALVAKFFTTHYEVFRRFVIIKHDKKFTKWFLTSSLDTYTKVIKGIMDFHDYTTLRRILEQGINLNHFIKHMEHDRTAVDMVKRYFPK